MLTVLLDVQLTRRKRVNICVDHEGMPKFSASRIGEVFDWLREEDTEGFNVETEDGATYFMTLVTAATILTLPQAGADEPTG